MTKGWMIVLSTGEPDEPGHVVERFIVAVADRDKAIELLRKRRNPPPAAKILVFGEAPDLTMAFLNAKRGEVYAVAAVV